MPNESGKNISTAALFTQEALFRLRVSDVMTRNVVTASPSDTLRVVQNFMKKNRLSGIPITLDNRILGIISVDDIIRALDFNYIEDRVEAHMSRNMVALEETMPLSFAVAYFEKFGFGRFPVISPEGLLSGILTGGDILRALLQEVSAEAERLSSSQPHSIVSPRALYRSFEVYKYDFSNAGKASQEIKAILTEAQLAPGLIRRIAVGSYELEMNLALHSDGGNLSFSMSPSAIDIIARDNGPGIPDVSLACTEGFSTANDWIKSMGFGAGMGLPNVKRVSDEFDIASIVKLGTIITARFFIPPENKGSL